MINIDYDKEFDTLYLRIEDNSQSYGAEVINNINVFRDIFSDKITGFLIFGFMEKYKNDVLSPLPFGINIDYSKEVISISITTIKYWK